MYRRNEKQLEFIEFDLPFGGKLLSSNRWVRLAKLIPWEEFEEAYQKKFSQTRKGPPVLSARMALAALIIKERLGVSDEECVEQIREIPYLQYFCGLKAFSSEPPFHPTMLVHFRKRFSTDLISRINDSIVAPIEGKFGQGKRRYGIGRVMTILAGTSETAIALCFLVMSLEKWVAAIFLCLYFNDHNRVNYSGPPNSVACVWGLDGYDTLSPAERVPSL